MATTVVTPDPETMNLEELRKLAEEEAKKQSTNPSKQDDPPQDDPAKQDDPPQDDPDDKKEFVAQKSFDLGDGAGSQVYKGHGATKEEALEDLSNKLIEAQKNATARIKELKKATTPAAPTVKAEDEAVLAAELVAGKPTEVVAKILKDRFGLDPQKLKEATEYIEKQKVTNTRKSTADAFVKTHPDYADTDRNGKLINKWCELYNDFSLDGMNKAYQDLSESGLLQAKDEGAGVGQDKDKPTGGDSTRKVEVTPSQPTKKASGISTHRRTPAVVATEPSEDELYSMPLDKLRQLSNKVLAGQ